MDVYIMARYNLSMISIIVARAKNGVIGSQNDLPWYLPDDLKRFKELTTGHVVIMGRKTYESILKRLGKPLPNRRNIVITRDAAFVADGAEIVHSLDEALEVTGDQEVFIIGGAQIYELALPRIDRLYITEINAEIDGDVYFPTIVAEEWQEIARQPHPQDEKHSYAFDFVSYQRI